MTAQQTLILPKRRQRLKGPPKRKRLLVKSSDLVTPQRPTGDRKFKNKATTTLATAITPETLAYSLPGGLAKLAFPNWIYGPHLKAVEDYIIRILNGESIKLMVSMPPRHGKTMFLSRVLPAFFLGRFPDTRVMLITHHTDFSRTQSRVARNIIDAFGKTVFDIEISPDTASAGEWDIAGGQGGMEALGAGGSVMGKGANLLLMDDLVKGIEMASNVNLMEKQWEWFKTDVYPRMEPGASAIIIMTRWTTYDIIGMIEQEKKEDPAGPFAEWETINFPAFAIDDDVLGREPGQPLFPARIDKPMLKRIQGVMDDIWWEALYQGNPVPAKGDIIDTDWIKSYGKNSDRALPNRRKLEMLVISADTAQKETEIADFTAIGIWGILDGEYYLLDLIRKKMGYPKLIAECRALNEFWKADFFLIEDKGSGQSLVQELENEDGFNIVAIDPGNENKVLRLMAETPSLKAFKVLFPEEASWLDSALLELRAFPRGRKDIADMLSQFLKFMRRDSDKLDMW